MVQCVLPEYDLLYIEEHDDIFHVSSVAFSAYKLWLWKQYSVSFQNQLWLCQIMPNRVRYVVECV